MELSTYKKNTLFLINNNDINDFLSKMKREREYNVMPIYKNVPSLIWFWAKKHLRIMKLPCHSFWYGNWTKVIDQYDTIIIFAFELTMNIVPWIKKHFPQKRIIFWYWNPVFTCPRTLQIEDKDCERWTFDMEDAHKYNMHYNTSYYFKEYGTRKMVPIKYDVVFIGADKGKYDELMQNKQYFIQKGISVLFYIVGKKRGKNRHKDYQPYLKYDSFLEILYSGRVSFDITQEGQSGITVRCLEAMYNNKKLITNNPNIVSCKFYNKDNIFILGRDDLDGLEEFINKDFVPIEEDKLLYYDFDNWFKRLFMDEVSGQIG